MSLPIIDLTRPTAATAPLLGETCENIGFFLVRGHGVPVSLVNDMVDTSRRFFDLSVEQKMAVAAKPGADRGYRALGAGKLGDATGRAVAPDLRENYFIGPPDLPAGKESAGFFSPNVWPEALPEMAEVCTSYYKAMTRLADHLLMLSALALSLPQDYFEDYNNAPISQLTMVNYPEQRDVPGETQFRASEHTDFGALTLLLAEDKPGGLQVLQRDGTWLNVAPPEPSCYIVNIGDLMARWTNNRWKSTVHRVVNPPRDKAMVSRRQSIVFFHHPNEDANIECLPTCVNGAALYEPTTPGRHLREKLAAVYGTRAN
jgi:isopenicillin N synthase-like dioxygenase